MPHVTEGRYSKVLPLRMAAQFAESEKDENLLVLRSEIALTDARLADLIARVDTGESGALWGQLQQAKREMLDAKKRDDKAAGAAAMNELLRLIDRGHADYQAWRDVAGAIEQRRKLVESERKRLVEMQQMVTTERLMLLLGAVVKVIQDNISDRSVLANITEGIHSLLIIDRQD